MHMSNHCRFGIVIYAALSCAGCAEDSNVTTYWWQDAASSSCVCPSNAPECAAEDCELVNFRGMSSDGFFVQGVVTLSPSRHSATILGMYPGSWQLEDGNNVRFNPNGGHSFVVPAMRQGDGYVVNNVVQKAPPVWLQALLDGNAENLRAQQ